MRRGEIWTLADGRSVLVVSLDGLEDAFGAVLAIVLHPSGRYPDTAMSVMIGDPMPCTAVAVNLQQLRAARFGNAECIGMVPAETMARVDQALRAVLDLPPG
ncbi:type II toxin-antitoxin system PemK/MazF family toxin [Streptomyces sioyaensis]|uniref:type II toxin-antitoxin system PemK/MazF family toxin n=1 Tax=Streptomyces sioyaensis TaxID=67364 RepID=UPI0033F13949